MSGKLFGKAINPESLGPSPANMKFGLWQASVTYLLTEGGGQSMGSSGPQ